MFSWIDLKKPFNSNFVPTVFFLIIIKWPRAAQDECSFSVQKCKCTFKCTFLNACYCSSRSGSFLHFVTMLVYSSWGYHGISVTSAAAARYDTRPMRDLSPSRQQLPTRLIQQDPRLTQAGGGFVWGISWTSLLLTNRTALNPYQVAQLGLDDLQGWRLHNCAACSILDCLHSENFFTLIYSRKWLCMSVCWQALLRYNKWNL